MAMNIIFLDVDGPLIPGRMYYSPHATFDKQRGLFLWDHVAVGMIIELCKKHHAKVVFNTAHNERDSNLMHRKANLNGLSSEFIHEDCRTLYMINDSTKREAISAWMSDHTHEYEYHVVIDDDILNIKNHVKVDFNIGMTIENFFEAEAYLQGLDPGQFTKSKLVI